MASVECEECGEVVDSEDDEYELFDHDSGVCAFCNSEVED